MDTETGAEGAPETAKRAKSPIHVNSLLWGMMGLLPLLAVIGAEIKVEGALPTVVWTSVAQWTTFCTTLATDCLKVKFGQKLGGKKDADAKPPEPDGDG